MFNIPWTIPEDGEKRVQSVQPQDKHLGGETHEVFNIPWIIPEDGEKTVQSVQPHPPEGVHGHDLVQKESQVFNHI